MTTSPYSNDLRKKVINYLNQGKSQKEASKVFGIHRNTLSRWETRYRKEGSYAARPRLGCKSKLSYSEVELFVQDNPDTKLSNIGSKFAIAIAKLKLAIKYKKVAIPCENESITASKNSNGPSNAAKGMLPARICFIIIKIKTSMLTNC